MEAKFIIMEQLNQKAQNLLKEATSLKKSNIDRAILLIKEAMSLVSDSDYSMTFKLASYYHLGGFKKEAYNFIEDALQSCDINDIGMYNMRRAMILDHKRALFDKDKLLKESMKTSRLSSYNRLLGFACQGGRSIEFKNMLAWFFEAKHNAEITLYIESITSELYEIVRIADEVNSDKELYRTGSGSIGEIYNSHIKKNQNFMKNYVRVNDGKFEAIIESL